METERYYEEPAKIEVFEAWMARHVNWQKVIEDFLPIWDRIVIDRDSKGSVAVKCYSTKE